MTFFRYLALLVLLLLPLMASGEETEEKSKQTQKWTAMVGLVTRHVNPSDDTNESSYMLGLSYSNWVLTRFTNSYHRASVFGGGVYRPENCIPFAIRICLFRAIYMQA